MLIDAVFPAASELVMLVGGAIAAGAFGASITLFGVDVPEGFWSFLAVALAGTLGYLIGSIGGWWIGLHGGRPLVERRGRWFHLTPEHLERAERWFGRYTVLTAAGSALWCFPLAAIGWALGTSYDSFDAGFRFVELAVIAGVLFLAGYLILSRRRAF